VAALEDVLLRVSALADDLPAVAELDCNPLVVQARGAVIVDARVRRAAPTAGCPRLTVAVHPWCEPQAHTRQFGFR
jgi:ATP-grasp domain